jgi:hypothetical protein
MSAQGRALIVEQSVILLFVALCALSDSKGLLAIVTGAAGLACLHVSHLVCAFLHREDFGLRMAICALESGISVRLPIEYDLARCFFIVFNLFSRSCRHRQTGKTEDKTHNNCKDKKPLHKKTSSDVNFACSYSIAWSMSRKIFPLKGLLFSMTGVILPGGSAPCTGEDLGLQKYKNHSP